MKHSETEYRSQQKKHQGDSRAELDKLGEETRSTKDKLQKLAVQFDKELSERDKIMTMIKKETLGELQKVGGQLMGELEI